MITETSPTSIRPGEVTIPFGEHRLVGLANIPEDAQGIVVFAHGSGSSRLSPRNAHVASLLREARLGTLLFDLLTPTEERNEELGGRLRFDIPEMGARLLHAIRWVDAGAAASLPMGLFGASTGAAAALLAAAERPERVAAVVSRGGRPDLAGERLAEVRAPTLLIVGGYDRIVIDLNREAATRLGGPVELNIVAGASHLFEEPGKLEEVSRMARQWFVRHLGAPH
jgi:putative phosphoribosyl transferase